MGDLVALVPHVKMPLSSSRRKNAGGVCGDPSQRKPVRMFRSQAESPTLAHRLARIPADDPRPLGTRLTAEAKRILMGAAITLTLLVAAAIALLAVLIAAVSPKGLESRRFRCPPFTASASSSARNSFARLLSPTLGNEISRTFTLFCPGNQVEPLARSSRMHRVVWSASFGRAWCAESS
jgi:hypothetical protein